MGGAGFGQGLIHGLQQAQDRQLQFQELKLRQDHAKALQKSMETEDQMKQLQLQSLQQKIEREARLPSLQAGVMGIDAEPLREGEQGPMPVPNLAPEIDRRKLATFLQAASQAGQDPMQLLQLMSLSDPRIKAIQESLQPEKIVEVEPGKSVVGVKPGGGPAREIFKAPAKPEKPVSVAPGGTLVDPTTNEIKFQAPAAPAKPPDFGDRLESAATLYGQTVYGKTMTFTELLATDPIAAAKVRRQAMVDEPIEISAARTEAIVGVQQKKLLTPDEANKLGVEFGTTQEQAKGIMPITAHQRESLAGYDVARTIIADIAQYSEKVNTAAGGLKGKAEQSMKLWGAWTQSNPDAAMLQSKAGELASIARSLGEKGALANQDVARAAALVPGIMDARQVAQQKIRDMLTIIDKGEMAFRKSLGIDARAPGKSSKALPPVPPPDPLAHIPVPDGLTPQQQQVYREAYVKQQQKVQQEMLKKTPNAKPSIK